MATPGERIDPGQSSSRPAPIIGPPPAALAGLQGTIRRARAAGVKAWIVKPFNSTQLLDAVSKLILP